jgi:hypothetical protein
MSFNATLLQPKVGHPTAAELYSAAGTDLDSLSTLEQLWAQWYLYIGDPVIATGLLSFLLHEVRDFFDPSPHSLVGHCFSLVRQILTVPFTFPPDRLYILAGAYHGSSSTQFHILENGNSNRYVLVPCPH